MTERITDILDAGIDKLITLRINNADGDNLTEDDESLINEAIVQVNSDANELHNVRDSDSQLAGGVELALDYIVMDEDRKLYQFRFEELMNNGTVSEYNRLISELIGAYGMAKNSVLNFTQLGGNIDSRIEALEEENRNLHARLDQYEDLLDSVFDRLNKLESRRR